jgi:hypothetical protein
MYSDTTTGRAMSPALAAGLTREPFTPAIYETSSRPHGSRLTSGDGPFSFLSGMQVRTHHHRHHHHHVTSVSADFSGQL